MEINLFKTDTELENNGVWRPCGDARILIGSITSEAYKKTFRRLLAPHETAIALNVLDEKVAAELENQALSESVILGWEGITEDGAPLAFSQENALRLIRSVPRFKEFILREANSIDNFRKRKEEAETKNSAPASAGN